MSSSAPPPVAPPRPPPVPPPVPPPPPRGPRLPLPARLWLVAVLVLGGWLVTQLASGDAEPDAAPAPAEAAEREAGAAVATERITGADAAARRPTADGAGEAGEDRTTGGADETDKAERAWAVYGVVDGDTVDVRGPDGTEERVRIIGIDTPERGECGFGEASSAMTALVLDRQVTLTAGARDDRDRYDRILRYVDVAGVDAGLSLIEEGLAIARYDSRDGYGRHDREAAYVAADAATDHTCVARGPARAPTSDPAVAPAPPSSSGPGSGPDGAWRNCTEARDHRAAPVHRGEPGYGSHLDRDGDGVGCE